MARHAAYERLREAHPDEWAVLYDQEREARGLPPVRNRKAEKLQRMRDELARLQSTITLMEREQ